MRIGTYNVLGFQGYPTAEGRKALGGPETEAAAEHFARVFAELDCDILALQEGVSPEQVQRVRDRWGGSVATFLSPVKWPGHLLTRYPIRESRTFSNPAPDAETRPFSRTCGAALLEVPDEGGELYPLWVVVVHLHPNRLELRAQEGALLAERVVTLLTETPNVIVLGDFNCPISETNVHSGLEELGFVNAMAAVSGGIVPTMDTEGVTRREIDHIYVSPALAPRLKAAQVVRRPGYRQEYGTTAQPGAWVHSDHLPVLAELAAPHP